MACPLEGGEKDNRYRAGEAEAHEGQDSEAVRNAIVAPFSVIHSKSQCPALLPTNVTEQFLVEAGLDTLVMFPAAMLVCRDSARPFTVG